MYIHVRAAHVPIHAIAVSCWRCQMILVSIQPRFRRKTSPSIAIPTHESAVLQFEQRPSRRSMSVELVKVETGNVASASGEKPPSWKNQPELDM